MSEHEELDALLKARFDSEHRHVPADPFVAGVMHKIRAERRLFAGLRTGLYAAVLAAAVLASPWLIEGTARMNAALATSLAWVAGLPGVWVMGVVVLVALVAQRVLSR